MIHLKRLLSRLKNFFQGDRAEAELNREIRSHLALMEEDYLRAGMSAEDARLAALKAYGGVEQAKQMHRDERSLQWLEQASRDVRYAVRQLIKSPGFAATVVLTIALGIGANTAIFTLVHAILLKSLPVGDPKSLYRIGDDNDCCLSDGLENNNGDVVIFSYPSYQAIRDSTKEFEQLAAMQAGTNPIGVRVAGGATRAEQSEFVSGNYFSTLGVGAFAGRALTAEDDRTGAAPVAVMSYQSWQADFGSDPSLVGSTVYLDSEPVTVVGIAAPGFFGDRISNQPPAFWIPLSNEPLLRQANSVLRRTNQCWLYMLGRLRPGTPTGPLQQKISIQLRQWLLAQDEYRIDNDPDSVKIPKVHVVLAPAGAGIQDLQRKTGRELYLLLIMTGFVLLVACANVANLLLARSNRRKAEISMRMALGATRSRLIRQMLTESLLLGCLGGLAGLAVAYAGTHAMLALAFPDSPNTAIHATPSLTVLGFAFLLSLVTGVVFGIVPAWVTSHGAPEDALRGGNRLAGNRTSLPQKSLIVFQAALSVVLLVGAALLSKSLLKLEHQNFGLQTANRYVLHINPANAGYKPESLEALHRRLEERFAAIPGMRKVGLASYSPLDGNQWDFDIFVPGRPAPGQNDDIDSLIDLVNPDFLDAVGQPVIRGRGLKRSDTASAPLVAVVNQTFAKKFFPAGNAIGQHFGIFNREDVGAYEIVGIVADAKYMRPRNEALPMFFSPLSQWERMLKDPTSISLETQMHYITSLVMNFREPPQNLDETVGNALRDINPDFAILDLRSFEDQVAGNFNRERLIARLTTLFGALTLILAAIGLYGITSYFVTQKTREIGLRMALGANRHGVTALVMKGAFLQVAAGMFLGIPIALTGAHFMASQLYETKPWDPMSLLAAVVVLAGAATVAGYIPARRAASIDPVRALRSE